MADPVESRLARCARCARPARCARSYTNLTRLVDQTPSGAPAIDDARRFALARDQNRRGCGMRRRHGRRTSSRWYTRALIGCQLGAHPDDAAADDQDPRPAQRSVRADALQVPAESLSARSKAGRAAVRSRRPDLRGGRFVRSMHVAAGDPRDRRGPPSSRTSGARFDGGKPPRRRDARIQPRDRASGARMPPCRRATEPGSLRRRASQGCRGRPTARVGVASAKRVSYKARAASERASRRLRGSRASAGATQSASRTDRPWPGCPRRRARRRGTRSSSPGRRGSRPSSGDPTAGA